MSIEDDLVAAFEPWITDDLETYLRSIGQMFAEVELYTDDTDDAPGWGILLDVDVAPVAALPHLAMYVGERLPVGIEEVMAREWIKDAPNQIRGTLASIVRVAQRHLTGQRTVSIIERQGLDGIAHADRITVITYTTETPNPVAVQADLRRDAIPADIVLFYETREGQSWADVATAQATWALVAAEWPTWEDVRDERPGFTTYTRPRP